MRLIFLSLILSLGCFAQATLTLSVPSESDTSISFSSEMVSSAQAQIKSVRAVLPQTTLTGGINAAVTTIPVAATAGVSPNMGALIGSEVCLITAVGANSLTVVRARVGTSAASALSGATVTYLQSGSYGAFVKNILISWAAQNLAQYPGPTISGAQSSIATQNATIQTAITGAVQ